MLRCAGVGVGRMRQRTKGPTNAMKMNIKKNVRMRVSRSKEGYAEKRDAVALGARTRYKEVVCCSQAKQELKAAYEWGNCDFRKFQVKERFGVFSSPPEVQVLSISFRPLFHKRSPEEESRCSQRYLRFLYTIS